MLHMKLCIIFEAAYIFGKYIDVVHGKEYLKENSRVFAGIV